jgi:hypothetical protein
MTWLAEWFSIKTRKTYGFAVDAWVRLERDSAEPGWPPHDKIPTRDSHDACLRFIDAPPWDRTAREVTLVAVCLSDIAANVWKRRAVKLDTAAMRFCCADATH